MYTIEALQLMSSEKHAHLALTVYAALDLVESGMADVTPDEYSQLKLLAQHFDQQAIWQLHQRGGLDRQV